MSTKTTEILEKVSQDRGKGDYPRALKRLREGIDRYPTEPAFYQEAMEIALESGETLAAIDFFKKAMRKLPERAGRLWDFAADKVRALNDPILCKFLVDLAIKKRDLKSAETALAGLKNHTAVELLKRTQTKIQSMSSAVNNGFAFKGEIVAGALAEGMLCLRAKRFQHGVKAFLRILDEKPVEQEVLTPFFAHLEKKYPRQGGISYVLGCCYLADEKYVKAFPKLCQGASLAPSLAEDAISRLEAVKDRPSVPQEEINVSLARLFIVKGDDFCAAERFGAVLEKNMSRAPVILDILKPFVQDGRDSLVLDYVFMDAALLAQRPETALVHMKKIGRDRRLRNELLGWMDKKSQEQALSVDILSYYAELALDQGRFERAVEVFREVVALSPADARVAAAILERHRAEPAVQDFYNDLGAMRPEVKPTTGGFEIEHYGGREFTLDSNEPGAPPPPVGETPPPSPEAGPNDRGSERENPAIVLEHTTDIPDDTSDPAPGAEPSPEAAESPTLEPPGGEQAPIEREEPIVPPPPP
ncbi:MAG: tetratricopeptide repeat protein, partial [Candidatus Krumholzibacteriia bacterium]